MPTPPEQPVRSRSAGRLAAVARVLAAYLLAMLPMIGFWFWQGYPAAMEDAPSSKIPCVSYAPYRDGQSPFDKRLVIPPEQIAADLSRLAEITACVRTYSVDQGLDAVPRLAAERGMAVMLGAWIGRERPRNELEIATVITLANQYPQTVRAVIVGNEVLLRRDQPPGELAPMITRVRDAVHVPVTYADVWEFWEQHPEVGEAVDFVTIHTLPYWEDAPTAIGGAIPHVLGIWRRLSEQFPGKMVFIGEAGWPSAGRMRDGARPSLINQARFVRELMVAVEGEGIGLNVIESFDQPWKRRLEGTVGGHWGLLDTHRQQKFPLTGPVSGDPRWLSHLTLAAVLGLALLAPAAAAGRRVSFLRWLGLALAASGMATLLAIGIQQGFLGSWTVYDWLVLCVRIGSAFVAASLVLAALADGRRPRPLPMGAFVKALRGRRLPRGPWRETALGCARAVVLFGGAATTLCLLFDARYRDFPSALYAVPAIAFLLRALAEQLRPRRRFRPDVPPLAASGETARAMDAETGDQSQADGREDRLLAGIAAAGGLAIAVSEGLANTQALAWTATMLLLAGGIWLGYRVDAMAATYRRSSVIAPSSSPPAAGSGT